MDKKKITADFLFARPSAISGLSRFFDFSGSFDEYNHSDTPDEADVKAMYADWFTVGDTLYSVISHQVDEESDEAKAA